MSVCRNIIFMALSVLLACYIILSQFPPSVSIINKTDTVIYIHVIQWPTEIESAEELTYAEISQLKGRAPIQPQQARDFTASFGALADGRLMRFSPGWDIGSPSSSNSTAGGSHSFDLDSHKGSCRVEIEIYNDFYKIIPQDALYCYKKLRPTGGRMIVHTKEKTFFNDYGPDAEKIEKQFIRWN